MSTSLSTLVDNLSNRIYDKHKCDSCGYNLEYIRRKKSGKLLFKCFNCKRKSFEDFDEGLTKNFENAYRFCIGDIDKSMLLLRKRFMLINIWMIGTDLMKKNDQIKVIFIVV